MYQGGGNRAWRGHAEQPQHQHHAPPSRSDQQQQGGEKAAIPAKCSGTAARSRCASFLVRNRIRRVGSFSIRTRGTRFSHSQSFMHILRTARTISSKRFAVALLTPSLSFTSVMRSIAFRVMASKGLPPKWESSQRKCILSVSIVALCDCSLIHRTTASFQVRRGFRSELRALVATDLSDIVGAIGSRLK